MNEISWQYTLGILIVVNSISVVLLKMASDKLPEKKSKGVFYQYLFCAFIAILYFFWGKASLSPGIITIGIVGFINCFGCYFQWQAFGFSLSKSVLFFPLIQVISMVLAVIFLAESTLWNFQLIIGVILCFLTMWIFRLAEKRRIEKDKTNLKEHLTKNWFFFILLTVLITGAAAFMLKIFSYNNSRETFLLGWYCGAFLATPLLLRLEKTNPFDVPKKTILLCFVLGIAVVGALLFLYWTYQLGGPISLVNPVQGTAVILISAFVGLFLLGEKGKLSRLEWLTFIPGTIGAILVLTS